MDEARRFDLRREFWTVPPHWRGATVVIIGGGQSLTPAQVEHVRIARERGECRAIGINNAYQLANWLDILYFCDSKWWEWHKAALVGRGSAIVTLENPLHDYGDPRIKVLKNYGDSGLVDCRDGVMHGANSGYQAAHLAIHLGAARIVLLGMDMHCRNHQPHWFGHHPDRSVPDYERWKALFATMKAPAEKLGVEIVNCTPGSALTCFRSDTLDRVLPHTTEAALPA